MGMVKKMYYMILRVIFFFMSDLLLARKLKGCVRYMSASLFCKSKREYL